MIFGQFRGLGGVQNGANMAPKWLPAGLWGGLVRQVCSQSLPGRLWERLRAPAGANKNSLVAAGGGQDEFWSEVSALRGAP